MTTGGSEFPIRGVVGVVGGSDDEVRRQLARLEELPGIAGVEVRADLFTSCAAALHMIEGLANRWPVLFTARLEAEGGAYRASEDKRIEIYGQALQRGATLIDVELRSEASRVLADRGAPLLVSHHDFDGMISEAELERLTEEATSLSPLGIKIVPTATRPIDGLRVIEWVAAGSGSGPRRIGFAMGDRGVFSRILTLAWGAPFTYGSLTGEVAPGQLSAHELLEIYRAPAHTRSTRVLGVIGNPVQHSLSPHMHNPALERRGLDAVYVPLALERFSDLEDVVEPLGVSGVSVTIPFKQDAKDYAASTDEASATSGATNTLAWKREPDGNVRVQGWNTDVDGVLAPLARRRIQLEGLSVGILGNGGAARGAAGALMGAGARVTIYYRDKAKGEPVARALGCKARPMKDLSSGDHALMINATPLGLHVRDDSPVPSTAFDRETVAFDMIYDPPDTPFLRAAAGGGARILIPGREMLICQGIVQFRLFTGEDATYDEFEVGFLSAQEARHADSAN